MTALLTLQDATRAIKGCNSYSRLPAIIDLAHQMEERDWLMLLGDNWDICDNIAQNAEDLFVHRLAGRKGVSAPPAPHPRGPDRTG